MQDGSELVRRIVAESEVAPFAPGYVLAKRWKILDRIGKGGFGFVYSALDLELDAKVAIKVLRPEHETRTATIARFKQEIQLARQVTHRNVCRIYDMGFYSQGDLQIPFLSMELLDGYPLDQRLRDEGALSLEEVGRITQQVGDALDAAHSAGIVHADLKPGNIMLVGEGEEMRAVVTDFGLASAHATASDDDEAPVVGTPAYMAPEQVEGKRLTPAADFYALGCTLYQLLSGELPFLSDTPVSTARARLASPPPSLSDVSSTIPSRWVGAIRDLMRLEPESRLATGAELRRRLRPSRLRLFALAGLVSALALAALFFFVLREPSREGMTLELSLPTDPEARALYDEGLRQWENFRLMDAIATWESAVEKGHEHPLLYSSYCHGLRHLRGEVGFRVCIRDLSGSHPSLSPDERAYYEAFKFRYSSDHHLKATKLLLRLLERFPNDIKVIRLYVGVQRQRQEYEGALKSLRRARVKTERDKIALVATEVNILVEAKRYEEAIEVALGLLPRVKAEGMARHELAILDGLALSTRNSGQLDLSLEYAKQSMALAQELQSSRYMAEAASLLVGVAMRQRKFQEALELVDLRKAYLIQSGDQNAANQMSITRAEILTATGYPRQADKMLSDVTLPALRGDENTYWSAYAQAVRAGVRRSLLEFEAAAEDCSSAATIFSAIKRPRMRAYADITCAEVQLEAGRFDMARGLLENARSIREDLNLELLLLQNSTLEAELALAEGKAKKALAQAAEVANEYQRRDLPTYEIALRNLEARAALLIGDAERARVAIDRALQLGAGEHKEMSLQLRFTALHVDLLSGDAELARASLQALQKEVTELGYLLLAKKIEKALS
jgi:serine/threonine protein kinase